ncbi:hypothetical protein Lal_00026757 [Lupinus albus]|uniref:Putative Arf GTPase activating protein n=1 Tax=Lupinus albus TaxID=3870 RepID=A0A6A5LR09_LUPAL|nr:putative Arf GTPase activating protein [Lupinus albus]KAF1862233.1 hypothetical protein Lal_00026757 [Lupinus albus]
MASRLKEDEKNERIIRGLLKLTPNRRCINCHSLGPQYVCTNFWMFVCTNCSGIHREFTHRVKSVSMAKFTSQEVSALQEGGNQRAREIYFKEWDPQQQSLPDSSNVDRLRDFIKHVYVDRKFTGERAYDKPPRVKTGEKDDLYENRRTETYQGGPKSPQYEDTYERRYSDRSSPGGRSPGGRSPGGRSPGYDQESRQYGDFRRSAGPPPVVNDWRREDRFRDERKFEDHIISDGDIKMDSQSLERAKDLGSSSLPVVRPVRDILGENVVPLRISEPPKTNIGKAVNGSLLTQRTASSSSLASSNGNLAEVKLESTKSLIDFDDDPEPPLAPQPVVMPENSGDSNWACFDFAPEAKAAQGSSNANPLEPMLSQLSVPAALPGHVSGAPGGPHHAAAIPMSSVPVTGSVLIAAGAPTINSFSAFPPSGASVTYPGSATVSPLNNAGQLAGLLYQQPSFPGTVSHQPTIQQCTPPVDGASKNKPWNIPSVPTVQGHSSTPMPHAFHHANEANSNVVSQPSNIDIKPNGRTELPEDLFTVKYSPFPGPAPGWQMGAPLGMGTSIQYNNTVVPLQPIRSFPQPSKSSNPFDVSNEPTPVQAASFPSMSSLEGVLPSVTTSGTVHPSSLGNTSFAWNPPLSSSYVSVLPPQAQTLVLAVAPGAYMGQQMPTNTSMPRYQGIQSFGADGAAFGISNPDQQLNGRLSIPTTPNPFPAAGNPFG